MTALDIFTHLVSWRWQRNAVVAILVVGTLVDLLTGQMSLTTEYWMIVVKALAEAMLILNVGWTFIKACMVFPELAFWFSISSMLDN